MLLSTIKCGPLQRCGQETETSGGGWVGCGRPRPPDSHLPLSLHRNLGPVLSRTLSQLYCSRGPLT